MQENETETTEQNREDAIIKKAKQEAERTVLFTFLAGGLVVAIMSSMVGMPAFAYYMGKRQVEFDAIVNGAATRIVHPCGHREFKWNKSYQEAFLEMKKVNEKQLREFEKSMKLPDGYIISKAE